SMIDEQNPSRSRSALYGRLYEQLKELISTKSPNLIAGMATMAALLHAKLRHHFWTGFYFVAGEDELHVGPYQGAVACQVLKGRGVCLACARSGEPVIVPDVEAFPGHIACDSRSKSEIVIPLKKDGQVVAVLDVDSDKLAQFDEGDAEELQKIVNLLVPLL
ncbi:GAF domain-containing protein, partial [Gracilinema caldarium]|uniref:GAF domain-containing protein n=1 Tax=Gracilinema caldarium TaxID=215591 RepID=UPI0026EC5E09